MGAVLHHQLAARHAERSQGRERQRAEPVRCHRQPRSTPRGRTRRSGRNPQPACRLARRQHRTVRDRAFRRAGGAGGELSRDHLRLRPGPGRRPVSRAWIMLILAVSTTAWAQNFGGSPAPWFHVTWNNRGYGSVPTIEGYVRSEEHTSELQSPCNLVCRLLLEKKKSK